MDRPSLSGTSTPNDARSWSTPGSQGASPSFSGGGNSDQLRLTNAQLRDLRQIFDWLDTSGDDEIAASELLVALQATGQDASLGDAEELIRSVHATGDPNSEGELTLTWLSFAKVMEMSLKRHEGDATTQIYELLDKPGLGQLGPRIIKAALERYGCDTSAHSFDKMMRFIDTDGDGQVSLKEFNDALATR